MKTTTNILPPVTSAEARAFATAKLIAAAQNVKAAQPGARAELATAIGVWEGSTGEPVGEDVRKLLSI